MAALLRCAFELLPRHRIQVCTKTSKSREVWVRRYGKPVCCEATRVGAVVDGGRRLRPDAAVRVLAEWLRGKSSNARDGSLGEGGNRMNSFQWAGFYMTEEELADISSRAVAEWLHGAVIPSVLQ